MNILLNAANLRFGGGLTVGLNLVGGLIQQRPQYHFYLLHPRGLGYEQLAQFGNVTLYPVPDSFHSSLVKKLWYNEYLFRKLCREWQIDKVVAMGNVCFPAGGRPQLVFVQMPHLVYPESQVWKRMDWKSFLKNSLMDHYASFHFRFASAFAVQTEVMRTRFCKRYDIDSEKVALVPNAADHSKPVQVGRPDFTGGLKLLFLSKYYPHKNYECLVPLGKIIRERNLPVTITITISARESAGAADILRQIRDNGLQDIIQNIKHVPYDELPAVLGSHNGLFLPTLLETFSGAYAEALKYGRLIFTSYYDFATANLGEAAFYFDPLHAEHIAGVFQQAISQPGLIESKLAEGAALAARMPGWEEIADRFSVLIDNLS